MKEFLVLATFLSLLSCQSANQRHQTGLPQPNILWISCEDISPALGCYGDEYAHTPTLDRLAEEGVLYTRAYATAPICSPARSTLISGVYATTLGTQHLRSDIPLPEDFQILPQYLSEAGYFCSNNAKTDYNFNPDNRWNDQGLTAHWRNRPEGHPFFSVFNYGITHEGHANSFSEEDISVLEDRHDPEKGNLPPYYPDTPEMRKIWAHQYDLISVLDLQVEKLIGQLKEDGLYENTIIFFFSDHGFGLPRYKRWLYHTGLHVPLIIRVPEKYGHLISANPGSSEDQLVSFVDFAPSVLELAGIPIPKHMVGKCFLGEDPPVESRYIFGARSRADDVYDVSRCVIDDQYIYIRNYMPHRPYVMDAIIYGESKAGFRELGRLRKEGSLNTEAEQFWQPKAYEELYDLENDPAELNNLAGNPVYKRRVESMRGILYDWMVDNRDMGLLNESEMMNRSKGSSPYVMGTSDEFLSLELLKAANLCGNPEITLEEIIPLLDHSDSGVRYWALIALHTMGKEAKEASGSIVPLLEDQSPTVAIAAAELLFHHGENQRALSVLAHFLQDSQDPWIVLQAAISIRNLGEQAKPLLPLIGEVFPSYRGEVWGRYKDWLYSMFIGFALDQVYLNCGFEVPQ